MITVVIYINDQPIIVRGARNTMERTSKGETIYDCDDGRKILHVREDGAVKLAVKMLKGVKQL